MLLKIPKPDFIVLYNGTEQCPDEFEMKLSDAFMEAPDIPELLELTVKGYNVNDGHNSAYPRHCVLTHSESGGDSQLMRLISSSFSGYNSYKALAVRNQRWKEPAEEALAQIDDRGYAIPYDAGGRRVVKIGAAFDKNARNISRWLVNSGD
jgi:hypothetical protein